MIIKDRFLKKRLTDKNKEIPSLVGKNEQYWLNCYHKLAAYEEYDASRKKTIHVAKQKQKNVEKCAKSQVRLRSFGIGLPEEVLRDLFEYR